MPWTTILNGEAVSWLLEPDPANPSVRYFAPIDLLGKAPGDAEVLQARSKVPRACTHTGHAGGHRTRN